jgi:hypothetical protein
MTRSKIRTSGAERLTLSSTDITIASGDLLFGTSAKGVNLGVTSNTDGNTLDDYEQGTWTPSIASGGSGIGYTVQEGKYTKVGELVHAKFYIQISSGTMTSAHIGVSGFPFTSASNHYTVGTGWNNSSGGSITNEIKVLLSQNATTAYFYTQGGQNLTQIIGTTMGSGLSQLWGFTYFTDS